MKNITLYSIAALLIISCVFTPFALARKTIDSQLELLFITPSYSSEHETKLKNAVLQLENKAVPFLVKVLKLNKYPEMNRWHAMFLLTRIMGKEAAPYLAKFLHHPDWLMRLASLKCLLILNNKNHEGSYRKLLFDPALVVRQQALDNITRLNMKTAAPDVWKMMFHKENYISDKKGVTKRTDIINSVVKSLGDLGYKDVQPHLIKFFMKDEYSDLKTAIDYSLEKLTGRKSPSDGVAKKQFWSQFKASASTL